MKHEIANRADIKLLVDEFYKNIIKDQQIGYFFTEVVELNWDHHIPVMYQFWETVLLGKASYKGNPVKTHVALHQKEPLLDRHFDRWIQLWESTVDAHFQGEIAEEAKKKAITMKQLMMIKIGFLENPDSIQ